MALAGKAGFQPPAARREILSLPYHRIPVMPSHLAASDHLAVGDDPVPYQSR
jgi:hypothetical protein